jgi:hypothetical protein
MTEKEYSETFACEITQVLIYTETNCLLKERAAKYFKYSINQKIRFSYVKNIF